MGNTLPRNSAAEMPGFRVMNISRPPICPKCHQTMRFALVKGMQAREYRCIDCDGEDPFRSPEIGKLLDQLQPPK